MRYYPRYLIGQEVTFMGDNLKILPPFPQVGDIVKVIEIHNGENADGEYYEQYTIKTKDGYEYYVDHSLLTK